jgi:hypothetical protein
MSQQREFSRAEWAMSAVRDDVLRVTRGRPMHWVVVHDVAQRLGLEDQVITAAVRSAIAKGWFVGDGEPPHSVRLSMSSIQQPEPLQQLS